MKYKAKAEIDALVETIELEINRLGITFPNSSSKLDNLHDNVEQLRFIRDNSKFLERQAKLDFVRELAVFIESIPHSVRDRVITLAEELTYTGEDLLVCLCQEARALLLYDAIYAEVDAEHDLYNGMLARLIRGCIDHNGQVPNGPDRDALLCECPQILVAIENSYQNKQSR